MHMQCRRRSCVQVCSTSVNAPMPPSQRSLAANSVSVAAVHCIKVSVDPAGVQRGQRVEFVRQREDQMAVRHVEQLGQPRGAPGIALPALALRAVPIAAGVPAPLLGAAAVAAHQLAAQRRRAAADDGPPGARLRRAQPVDAQIVRAEGAQHLGQSGAESMSQPRSWHSSLRRRPLA
jgi:hypothetical protein